jgi:hypothetical protein
VFVEFLFEGGIEAFTPELHWEAARGTGAVFERDDFEWSTSTLTNFTASLND